MSQTTSKPDLSNATFEVAAADVLGNLQLAFAGLIRALPSDIRKAADVQRALGVDTKLGWQVYKVAHAPTPVSAGMSVPQSVSIRRLLRAATALNVPPHIIQRIEEASGQFESLVRRHAGNRTSFNSMLSAISRDGNEAMDLANKRAAFRAQSHIWGVQARASLLCHILRVSDERPDRLDVISIRGMYDLIRLRRNVPWIVSNTRISDDDGVVRGPLEREPIDPHEDRHGVCLLREFCSQPLPTFRATPRGDGFTDIQLEGSSVGNTAAVTCVMADLFRCGVSRYRDEHNRKQFFQKMVRTPTEVHVHDVLVPSGVFAPALPQLVVYGDHRNVDPAIPGRDCDLLTIHETVHHLGRSTQVLHSPHVPRYQEMVRYVLNRPGWDEHEFDVYRCIVQYPVMPSSVVMQFELLENEDR